MKFPCNDSGWHFDDLMRCLKVTVRRKLLCSSTQIVMHYLILYTYLIVGISSGQKINFSEKYNVGKISYRKFAVGEMSPNQEDLWMTDCGYTIYPKIYGKRIFFPC